jgi:hypothetical protein
MWVQGFYRFNSRAAFLAACDAAGWPRDDRNQPAPPAGVELDIVGQLQAPPSIVAGVAEPGEVIDARWHVNAAWHGVEPPEAFAAAAVEPATPSRAFALPPPAPPPEPGVPPVVAAWKGKAVLDAAGLLPEVETAVAAAGGIVSAAWAGATEWRRDSDFLTALADTIGLSADEVDGLFRQADAIRT